MGYSRLLHLQSRKQIVTSEKQSRPASIYPLRYPVWPPWGREISVLYVSPLQLPCWRLFNPRQAVTEWLLAMLSTCYSVFSFLLHVLKLYDQQYWEVFIILCLLLLLLALQLTVGYNLLSNSLPFRPFLTQFSPPYYSHYLYIVFNILNPSFPWPSSNSSTCWFPL